MDFEVDFEVLLGPLWVLVFSLKLKVFLEPVFGGWMGLKKGRENDGVLYALTLWALF